jgi:predicted TPR repeat methyltransferase
MSASRSERSARDVSLPVMACMSIHGMESRLSRSATVVLAPGEAGYLVFESRRGRLHRLNPTAALILELSDGTRGRDEVTSLVGRLAGVGGREAADAWIDGALRDGLLLEGLEHRPGPSVESLRRRVERLRAAGRILAAYVCQYELTERCPGDPDVWAERGELAHILGRRDDARESYERYQALRPDDAEVSHVLSALRDEAPPSRAPDACITQLYARFASFYDESMRDDLAYNAPERLARAITRALKGAGSSRALTVLDLGCGTGLSGLRLRDFAARLVGIDLSPEMLAQARARGVYDRLEVAEITAWLERGAATEPAFDLIAACDSLIYFGDLGAVLAPAARRLLPGGWLAFTVERGESSPFRLTDSGRYAHHRDHVREVASEVGLKLVAVEESVLRYEYGEPVVGLVVVLRASGG